MLESPTWRASSRWGAELGYSADELARLNRKAISLMAELREVHAGARPIVISGCLGPQADGYSPDEMLSADEARDYHSTQIGTFAETEAEMVTAITMTYVDEAIGITQAAADAGMPVAISFTTETDGRLPSGQPLGEAITELDDRTGGAAAYVMLNCSHPTHFEDVLVPGEPWVERIRGLRANASTHEPRRARRGRGARRRRPGGPRRPLRGAGGAARAVERGRRLLRHRRSPRRGDRRGLAGRALSAQAREAASGAFAARALQPMSRSRSASSAAVPPRSPKSRFANSR